MPFGFGVLVAKHTELILKCLNKYIASSQGNNLVCVLGRNVYLGSELTKGLSSVRPLGVVR